MSTSQDDTEITIGTGRMLALFFLMVLVCAIFFAIGFSFGRKASMVGEAGLATSSGGTPTSVVRPPAGKETGASVAQPTDANSHTTASNSPKEPAASPSGAQPQPADQARSAPASPNAGSAANGGYFVQVAAVTRQEDGEALVEALKKKQYPAFSAKSSATDRFYHVQVGPYADLKEAEAMKARLVADGYNPILKR